MIYTPMKDPKALSEDTFEKIKRQKLHGPHVAKYKRGRLPPCNGKRTYKDREDAEATRDHELSRGHVTFLRVYKCLSCLYWHLTHKKPR
jgi:hypothetical protein